MKWYKKHSLNLVSNFTQEMNCSFGAEKVDYEPNVMTSFSIRWFETSYIRWLFNCSYVE